MDYSGRVRFRQSFGNVLQIAQQLLEISVSWR